MLKKFIDRRIDRKLAEIKGDPTEDMLKQMLGHLQGLKRSEYKDFTYKSLGFYRDCEEARETITACWDSGNFTLENVNLEAGDLRSEDVINIYVLQFSGRTFILSVFDPFDCFLNYSLLDYRELNKSAILQTSPSETK